ncbi:MAG: hypothetical protein RLZZ504_966 [Bacteroidota bacterium]
MKQGCLAGAHPGEVGWVYISLGDELLEQLHGGGLLGFIAQYV